MEAEQTLKKIEGKDAGEEIHGMPVSAPITGRPFRFVHERKGTPLGDVYTKERITSPVRQITVKKERVIIRTENSVYSLEKKEEKK